MQFWSAQAVVTGGVGRAGIGHMVLEVERAKTSVGMAVNPASSQRLFKEDLESLLHFPKPQTIALFVLRMTQCWISCQQVILCGPSL